MTRSHCPGDIAALPRKWPGLILADGNGAVEAAIGRTLERRGGVDAGNGQAGAIARHDIEQRAAVRCGRDARLDPPMLRILRPGHGDVALEQLSGAVGTIRLDAAERRQRFVHQQAVGAEDNAEESEKADQDHPPSQLPRRLAPLPHGGGQFGVTAC